MVFHQRMCLIEKNQRSNDDASQNFQSDNKLLIADKKRLQEVDPPGEAGVGNDWLLILGEEQIIQEYIGRTLAIKK